MVHAAIMGAIERFLAILIEHFAGAFPIWLSPIQVRIIPVGRAHRDYAKRILQTLQENKIRADMSVEHETVGKNIREGELQKIPYLIVVGDKEVKDQTITVRRRRQKKLQILKLEEFLKNIFLEIETKKIHP